MGVAEAPPAVVLLAADPVVEVADRAVEHRQRVGIAVAAADDCRRRGICVAAESGVVSVVPSGGHGYVGVGVGIGIGIWGGAAVGSSGEGNVGFRVPGGLLGVPEEQPGTLAAKGLGLSAVGARLDAVVHAVDRAVVEGRAGLGGLVVVEVRQGPVLADDVAPWQTARHFFLLLLFRFSGGGRIRVKGSIKLLYTPIIVVMSYLM